MNIDNSFDNSLLENYYKKGYLCILYDEKNPDDYKTYYEFTRAIDDTIYYSDLGKKYTLINTEEYKKGSE